MINDWDNLYKKKIDSKLIGLTEPWEVRDWENSLGYPESEIRRAIDATDSHNAETVRAWLARHGRT